MKQLATRKTIQHGYRRETTAYSKTLWRLPRACHLVLLMLLLLLLLYVLIIFYHFHFEDDIDFIDAISSMLRQAYHYHPCHSLLKMRHGLFLSVLHQRYWHKHRLCSLQLPAPMHLSKWPHTTPCMTVPSAPIFHMYGCYECHI
jgi:hypothetical protein